MIDKTNLGKTGEEPPKIFDTKKSLRRKYYTTSQLMTRWGVSAPTVIRLIEEGSLRGLKIRGAYRVESASVIGYEDKVAF